MAIELVTGKAGVPHVDSEDVGAFNAYSLGSGAYIMDGCEVTAKSANSINIAAGEILWEGRHIRVKGSGERLPIDNGQTGYNRRDLITLNYAKDPNGIESVSFKVVKGTATTGTAADPSVKVGSILAGDTSAVIPFARITLSGLSVATPTVLLGSLPSLASLRDSVSPKTLVDGQIKSGESRTVHGIADWLIVGVYASAAAGDSDDREMLIPCLVGDRFLLGSSGCAVDGSNPRYVSVRFLLNGEVLKYVNVAMQDVENGNILNSRNANGVVGLIRR